MASNDKKTGPLTAEDFDAPILVLLASLQRRTTHDPALIAATAAAVRDLVGARQHLVPQAPDNRWALACNAQVEAAIAEVERLPRLSQNG